MANHHSQWAKEHAVIKSTRANNPGASYPETKQAILEVQSAFGVSHSEAGTLLSVLPGNLQDSLNTVKEIKNANPDISHNEIIEHISTNPSSTLEQVKDSLTKNVVETTPTDEPIETPVTPTDEPIETPVTPTDEPIETPLTPTDEPIETPVTPTDEPIETPVTPTDEPIETPVTPTDEPIETPVTPTDEPSTPTAPIVTSLEEVYDRELVKTYMQKNKWCSKEWSSWASDSTKIDSSNECYVKLNDNVDYSVFVKMNAMCKNNNAIIGCKVIRQNHYDHAYTVYNTCNTDWLDVEFIRTHNDTCGKTKIESEARRELFLPILKKNSSFKCDQNLDDLCKLIGGTYKTIEDVAKHPVLCGESPSTFCTEQWISKTD